MSQTAGRRHSGAFLIELIIVILFFACAGAVCLNLFAAASNTGDRATDLTQATLQAQTVLEQSKASGGDFAQVAAMGGGAVQDGRLTIYFDSQWQQTSDRDRAAYTLTATTETNDSLCRIRASVQKDGADICSLQTALYTGVSGEVAS